MRKNMKRLWAIVIAALMLAVLCAPVAYAAMDPDDDDFVQAVVDYPNRIYDELGIFGESESEDLQILCGMIAVQFDIDAVVHVVESTGGQSIRDYADDFYDYHADGFGIGPDYSGVLIVLQLGGGEGNRDYYFATTGDAIPLLSDQRIDALFNEAVDDLIGGDYYAAVSRSLMSIYGYATDGVEPGNVVVPDPDPDPDPNPVPPTPRPWWYYGPDIGWILLSVILGLAAGLIAVLSVRSNYKRPYQKAPPDYRTHSKLHLTRNEDRLVNSFVTTRIIQDDPPSSSGGSTSSTHTSSSGRSHGGGGGRF